MSTDRPLMVFDGDCGFCRLWIERWRHVTGERVEYAPYQQVAERFPEIERARFAEAVHLRAADGTWTRGAEAVFGALAAAPGRGLWLRLHRGVPPFSGLTEWAYRLVARHRPLATRVTRLLWGEHVGPPGERRTVAIFLRGFGLVALTAFLSLTVQVTGLVGPQGILPVGEMLAAARERYGAGIAWSLPTLCWLNAGDPMLLALAWGGAAASLLLALGLLPAPSLLAILVAYISLANAGRDFLLFQWDGLLIETALVALLLAPWSLRLRAREGPPPRGALRLARWLLFRLMFSSAVVKLASGDPTWRSLTALQFHYQTQPLPTWTAWYAHRLPAVFQSLSAAMMFAIEGLAPWLVLAPRRLRFASAFALVGLQLLIAATGNYGFFNALAILLCIPLLDDGFWPRGRASAAAAPPLPPPPSSLHRFVRRPLVILVALLGLVPIWGQMRAPLGWLGPLPVAYELLSPLRLVNPYGLFAIMTTERREISIEGSDDGVTWREYRFRWKPGDLRRTPAFVGTHMPRLDWQMWFAALGRPRDQLWIVALCDRLLHGTPPVLRLMGSNPLPSAPPRFVRATLWRYRFTTAAERRASGEWWRRELLGPYLPALTLVDGQIADAPTDPR